MDTPSLRNKESTMPKSKPPYPADFRWQTLELAQAGRSPAKLSREFGPTSQTIMN